MGLDPATATLIGSLAGPTIAGLFAPEGQELQSFSGHGSIDPVNMLHNTNTMIGRLGNAITDRAAQPISLRSAFAQQPTAFTGGGLPFPIGLSGVDPALGDTSLLSLPGMTEFEGIFDNLVSSQNPDDSGSVSPGGGYQSPDGMTGGDRRAVPKAPGSPSQGPTSDTMPINESRSAGPRRPGMGLRAADILDDNPLMPSGDDDLSQAHGAANLMLEALSGGDIDAVIAELGGRTAAPIPSPRLARRT